MALALHVIAAVLFVSALHGPTRRRQRVPRRTAADIDAERRRLTLRRAAIEGRPEPERPRIPYASLEPAPEEPRPGLRLPAFLRRAALPRSRQARVALPLGVAFVGLLVASTALVPFAEPAQITARPPATYAPIAVTGVTTPISVNHEPDSAIVVDFSTPMDRADVAARLVVVPAAAIRVAWDATGTQLTIEARDGWTLGTYYTLTIPAGTLDASGARLQSPVRAAFLVRGPTAARITAPRSTDGLARLDTTIVVTFDRPVSLAEAAGAFSVAPAVAGSFTPASGSGQQLTFTPAELLAPGAIYTVSLAAGLLDAEGSAVRSPEPVEVRTVPRPRVRSTSPMAKATGVAAGASVLVRFTRPMDATSTIAAFSANVGGVPVRGTTILSDDGLLLTFEPETALPAGAGVGVRVEGEARSLDDVTLDAGVSFTFRVRGIAEPTAIRPPVVATPPGSSADAGEQQDAERRAAEAQTAAEKAKAAKEQASKEAAKAAKEKAAAEKAKAAKEKAAKAKAAKEKAAKDKAAKEKAAAEKAKAAKEKAAKDKEKAKPDTESKPASTKGKPPASAGSSSWIAVEAYYLSLVNCTRTGGWVSKSGKCTGAGSRKVAPLRLDAGLSANVARPYAKRLALAGACTHFSGGGPSTRLRRAGYSSHRWAENLSCPRGMTAAQTAVYSIRYFQNEKPWNGGHYRNLMNAAYDRAGIGIWVANGRVIIVTDFYKP
jgi:hypothetical protein